MKKRGAGLACSRRGSENQLLFEAMQFILAGMVLLGSIYYIEGRMSMEGLAKSFYARDIAMTLDALHSVSGNAYYLYDIKPLDEKNPREVLFSFEITNSTVSVSSTNIKKPSFYWHFPSAGFDYDFMPENDRIGIIKIAKQGNQIKTGDIHNAISYARQCPDIYTSDKAWKSSNDFIIDPADGEKDSELNSIALDIAESPVFLKIGNLQRTRQRGVLAELDERKNFISQNAGADTVIISIAAGNSIDWMDEAYARIYFNAGSDDETRLKSRKLGCMILNSMLGNDKLKDRIHGGNVIAESSDYINSVLPEGIVGVALELGNAEIDESFVHEKGAVAESIYNGIQNYYR